MRPLLVQIVSVCALVLDHFQGSPMLATNQDEMTQFLFAAFLALISFKGLLGRRTI